MSNKHDTLLLTLNDEEKKELLLRMLRKTDIPNDSQGNLDKNAPWIWKGCVDKNGYGRISVKGTTMRAHRVMHYLLRGTLPSVVRHRRPSPSDVNPYLLQGGTQQDNITDRQNDGTTARGTRHGRSKLDETRVREIRAAAAHGVSKTDLSKRFGVDRATIRSIVARKTWREV